MRPDQAEHSCAKQESTYGNQDQRSWLRFALDTTWTLKTKLALLEQFGTLKQVYANTQTLSGSQSSATLKHQNSGQETGELNRHLDWLEQPNHHFIHLNDPRYPELLREINSPPIGLFAIGNIELLKGYHIAIVGNRRPTPLGAQAAKQFASDLTQSKVVVVSGLALGIDGCAHQGALEQNTSSSTIAVMGCGLDVYYPNRHRNLQNQISEKGLLLSEFPLSTPAKRHHFPQRNRIISGICEATVIIEAAQKSGTLLTARLALEQNREVLVVPGSINSPNYQGSHQLIRQGACLVTNSKDILDALPYYLHIDKPSLDQTNLKAKISEQAQQILNFLAEQDSSIESIMHFCNIDFGQLSLLMLELEMNELIRQNETGHYSRIELS